MCLPLGHLHRAGRRVRARSVASRPPLGPSAALHPSPRGAGCRSALHGADTQPGPGFQDVPAGGPPSALLLSPNPRGRRRPASCPSAFTLSFEPLHAAPFALPSLLSHHPSSLLPPCRLSHWAPRGCTRTAASFVPGWRVGPARSLPQGRGAGARFPAETLEGPKGYSVPFHSALRPISSTPRASARHHRASRPLWVGADPRGASAHPHP